MKKKKKKKEEEDKEEKKKKKTSQTTTGKKKRTCNTYTERFLKWAARSLVGRWLGSGQLG